MNAPQVGALVRDAVYQVLDNWVFRILACLTLLPILLTFLVGFREEGIVLLFGFKSWSYAEVFDFFGGSDVGATLQDAQGMVIEIILTLVFDYLAGAIGVLFCIAAAAFFVPRLIEKGAADILFHKPLSRLTFYLSRFLAGLIFIGLVSALLVCGMYVGILMVSGYNDPGILFAGVSLTYLFGLVYSVCMLIGILTRSTVASILLTVLFFFGNGCVHSTWETLEQFRAAGEVAQQEELESEREDIPVDGEDDEEENDDTMLKKTFFFVLNSLHYTLPKTRDTKYMARKLRRAVDPPRYKDEATLITVYRLPDGTDEVALRDVDSSLPGEAQDLLGEARFAAAFADEPVAYSLWLRPALTTESERNGQKRIKRETTKKAADALQDLLEEVARDGQVERETTIFASSAKGTPISSYRFDWIEDGPGGTWTRVAFVFKGADANFVFTLLLDVREEATQERLDRFVRAVDTSMGKDSNVLNKRNWYEEKLRFDAEWKFNILFSIGSSLAFVVVMLLLGWWRLSKIEF
jgi:ABC-type transport system involved in multi-copper enzyme maturation permease subunit